MKFKIGERVRLVKKYAWLDFDKTYEILSYMDNIKTGPFVFPVHYFLKDSENYISTQTHKYSKIMVSENDLISLKELREKKLRKLNDVS